MIKVYTPRSVLSLMEVKVSVHRLQDMKNLFVNLHDHNIEMGNAFERGCIFKRNDYLAAKEALIARYEKQIKELKDENRKIKKQSNGPVHGLTH